MILFTRYLAATLLALLVVLVAGCGDDSSGPTQTADVDPLFQALADSLAAIPDSPTTDFVKNIRYPDIRAGFDAVLAAEPNNRKAHLGSAILDLIEVNYNAQLWAFIDSLETYGDATTAVANVPGIHFRRNSPILHNQFTLLATAPREFMKRSIAGIPANLTVAELQNILESTVIPALTSALSHLDVVDGGGGGITPILIQVEDELTEIDMGEVLFFHAATYAARAGLRIATAYDVGLPGPDGTYGWVDDARAFDGCNDTGYFEEIGAPSPYWRAVSVYYERAAHEASADSVIIAMLQWNLASRPAFLTERNGGMAAAFDDLVAARDLIASAVAAIRGEGDNQVDDIVRMVDLTDIDSDIATGTEKPDFATNFTTIEDVLDWVDQVMSGPYNVSETGSVGPIQFTVDLSGFFHSAPTDWRALLPYHQFKAPDTWLTDDLQYSNGFPVTPGGAYYVYDCVSGSSFRTDVAEVRYDTRKVSIDPIEFTDMGGTPIDMDIEKIPHMPDYTMGGLFPGANRAKWLEINTNSGG